MGSFNKSICTSLVSANSDVANVVLFCEIFEGCDKGRAIIGHDFIEGTPLTNDVFEDPIIEGCGIFLSKFLPFWIGH